jgi:hypothetical protein
VTTRERHAVASWRDKASKLAQDDLDGLLGPALEFAQQQLDARGEFYPFAVALDAAGLRRMVSADTGSNKPASADMVTTLIAALSEDRSLLRGVAVVADVHVRVLGSDAVRVTLEHSEGVALTVLLPYRPRRFGGVDYGEPQAGPAVAFIWPSQLAQGG